MKEIATVATTFVLAWRVREDGDWRIKRRKVAWDLLAGASPPAAPNPAGKQP